MSKLLGIKQLCEFWQAIKAQLNLKVDKVTGKGLSTNDFTTAEKNKLAGIAAGAEVNVQSDWSQSTTTADDYIKNKPSVYTKTESDNRYVNIDGDVMTGQLTARFSTFDLSKANNGVSSTLYPTTFNIEDSAGRITTRLEGVIKSDGTVSSYWYLRNYNTSGTQVAQKGIQMTMAKDGTLTYTVSDGNRFRSAIGVYSTTESDNRYVNVTGDTMTGGLTLQYGVPQYDIKAKGINLKAANNGSSSSQRPGYVIHDNNGLNVGQFITLTSSSGNVQTEMLAYNYNTSGTSVGTNYIQCNVTKSGAQTYAVANQANFRSAIGAAAASSSSKRYKHDIAEIQDEELDPHKLYDLPVKQFVFNDDHDLQYADMKGKTIPGFIAEDVAEIYPSAVIHDEDGRVESWDERRIIPAMLKLIQEQHEEIERLKQLIASA